MYLNEPISYYCKKSCGCGLSTLRPTLPTNAPTVPTAPTPKPTSSPTGTPEWPVVCQDDPNYASYASAYGNCASYAILECTGEASLFCNHNHCSKDGADWYCPVACDTCQVAGWKSTHGTCEVYSKDYDDCNTNYVSDATCNSQANCQWISNECQSLNYGYCDIDMGDNGGVVAKEACPIQCNALKDPAELAPCPAPDPTWRNGKNQSCDWYSKALHPTDNEFEYCVADGADQLVACPNICTQRNECIPKVPQPGSIVVSAASSVVQFDSSKFCGWNTDSFEVVLADTSTDSSTCYVLVHMESKVPVTDGSTCVGIDTAPSPSDFSVVSVFERDANCDNCPVIPGSDYATCEGQCSYAGVTKCSNDTACADGFTCKSGVCAVACAGAGSEDPGYCFCDENCFTFSDCCASRYKNCGSTTRSARSSTMSTGAFVTRDEWMAAQASVTRVTDRSAGSRSGRSQIMAIRSARIRSHTSA